MSDTPYRYTAALAAQIELAGRTAGTPRAPSRPRTRPARWADPEKVAPPGQKRSCWTCSRTRRGVGLHVGHPLGYIATDVYGRFKRMTGQNVLHAWATTRSACPPSSTPCRPASTRA